MPLPGLADAKALSVTEPGAVVPDTFVLLRGNPLARGDRVEPAFSGAPAARAADHPPSSAKSSGRRLALADWIASPKPAYRSGDGEPRVAASLRPGLVRTPSDFGLQGRRQRIGTPRLARPQFVRDGWSLKRLHRLLLTSQAYRASASVSPDVLRADPANDLFSRFEMRRLTAEEIRDSVLQVSGVANAKMFGPGFGITLPKEVLASQSVPAGLGRIPACGTGTPQHLHSCEALAAGPGAVGIRPRGDRSLHAGAVLHHPAHPGAGDAQRRVLSAAGGADGGAGLPGMRADPAACVRRTLALVTSRPPSDAEVARGTNLIRTLEQQEGTTGSQALTAFACWQ